MTRRYDPRRARRHLNYTRAELASLFSVGLPTICAWKKKGLKPIDDRRPLLFAGGAVQQFLEEHNKPRQPLEPGQIFCVACKQAIEPKDRAAIYLPVSSTSGNLVGICPTCGRPVFRRTRITEISQNAGDLKVNYEPASATINPLVEPPRTAPSDGIGL